MEQVRKKGGARERSDRLKLDVGPKRGRGGEEGVEAEKEG